jgi:hypothetical protein
MIIRNLLMPYHIRDTAIQIVHELKSQDNSTPCRDYATFDKALKAYTKYYPKRSTSQIGRDMGIPDDYNW